MFEDVLKNQGPLFAKDRLADLQSMPQWEDCEDKAAMARKSIRDRLEKHLELLQRDATEPQTKFFVVNPTLHALGYVYSIDESVPIHGDAKATADYTLFADPVAFEEVEPLRGGPAFFRTAVALTQVAVWGEPLDVAAEDPEVAAQQPAVLIDVLLRSSGVDYGIVTNGTHWRLIHRGSSDKYDTYLEMELQKVMEGPLAHFKLFYLLFGSDSLRRNDEGQALLDQFLKE